MEKLQAALQKARSERSALLADPELLNGANIKAVNQAAAAPSTRQDPWDALTTVPLKRRVLERHRIVTAEAHSAGAPFDILRTKVLRQMQQNGWKRLAITSPTPRTGKTTMACNLALGLGRQNDLRTILFDLDLRDPAVHKFLQVRPPHTLRDLFDRKVTFQEQAVRVVDNVAACMEPHRDNDPTRIMLAEKTGELLDEIERIYKPSLMIFDMPAMLVNDETRAFLKNVDCGLIVARAGLTRYGQFDTCEREMSEHTNVIGTVLNAYRYGRGS